jgi:hypothetical protein
LNRVDEWLQSVSPITSAVELCEEGYEFAVQFNDLAGKKIVGNWPPQNVTMPAMLNGLFEFVDWDNSSVGYFTDEEDSEIEIYFVIPWQVIGDMDGEDGFTDGIWIVSAIQSLLSPTVIDIEGRSTRGQDPHYEIRVLCEIEKDS